MFLSRNEIATHLYGEVSNEISRNANVLPYANLAAFPATGDATKTYLALDTGFYYAWATNAYVITTYKDPLDTAISSAVAEALGYLTGYDTAAIFDATGSDRNPILLLYIKDIAVWHYIQLSNPSVDMQLRLTRYEKAIDWLMRVQSGKTNPNLPLPAPPEDGSPQENFFKWGGNDQLQYNF
jgi:hypothetical protein